MSYQLTYSQGGLSAAADYIRSKGRNEDSQLVHMTPGEVQALQQMAVQHGGSLTINPQTGLPEAGFLGNILKVAAPIALSYFGGPMLGAAIAPGASVALQTGLGMGLISGGLSALTTGDLGKGLTTGLTSGLIGGAMASFNPAAASTAANPTATVATAVPAAEAAKAAQVSMMQHPSIINAGVNPVGSQIANAQSAINATAVNPIGATVANQAQAAANVPGVVNQQVAQKGLFDTLGDKWSGLSTPGKFGVGAAGLGVLGAMTERPGVKVPVDKGTIRPYTYSANKVSPYPGFNDQGQQGPMYDESGNAILDTQENRYYNPSYTALPTYEAAQGGLMSAPFGNNMYPQSQQEHTNFATPTQMPTSAEVVGADYDALTNAYSGQEMPRMADGGIARDSSPTGNMSYPNGGAGWGYDLALKKLGMQNQQNPESQAESYQYTYDPATQTFNKAMPAPAVGNLGKKALPNMGAMSGASFGNGFNGLFGQLGSKVIPEVTSGGGNQYQYNQDNQQFTKMAAGGLSTLGGYSDGGRMLKGPGDGMSDDIPGVIGGKQPARLADGEFVVPADVVSHLGNGSTDAGAKRLYSMMDKVRSARTGTKKQGKQIKADKYLPA